MAFKNIVYTVKDSVARLTINRPPLNILNLETVHELTEAVRDASSRADANLFIIDSAGPSFSVGADVKEHLPEKVRDLIYAFHHLLESILKAEKPSIAVVRGYALGGGMELSMSCDYVVASTSAVFGQPEIKLGVYPPMAAALLPRLTSFRNAMRIILTGEDIGAEEAFRMGLVTILAPEDQLDHEVAKLVSSLLEKSPEVLRIAKKAIVENLDESIWDAIANAEAIYLEQLMSTEDALEGLKAFLEKRRPLWRGR